MLTGRECTELAVVDEIAAIVEVAILDMGDELALLSLQAEALEQSLRCLQVADFELGADVVNVAKLSLLQHDLQSAS